MRRDAAGGRTLGEASRGSAVLASYVQAPPANALYGRTGWLRPGPGSRLARREGAEQDLFPGFCALVLAVAATFYPVLAVARQPPAEALRYE